MKTNKTYEALQEVNDAFIEKLKEGNPFGDLATIPFNFNTNKEYTGFNRLLLSFVISKMKYKTSKFLTFKQICEKGGAVKSGEKSFPIFFSSFSYTIKYQGKTIKVSAMSDSDAIAQANKKLETTDIEKKHISHKYQFRRYFNVFNLEQSDGLEYEDDVDTLANVHDLIKAQGANIVETKGFPFFNESENTLHIPPQDEMSDGEYFTDVFKTICDSKIEESKHQSEEEHYFESELVSYIAAAFLTQTCGIKEPISESLDPDLIDMWLKKINENQFYLWNCASKAQKVHNKIIEPLQEEEVSKTSA